MPKDTDAELLVRLPPRKRPPLLGSPLGDLLLRPWFDALTLPSVVKWYFPLSRAWAAGTLATTSVERFAEEIPGRPPSRRMTELALGGLAPRQRAYRSATEAWESAVFAAVEPRAARLVAAERDRQLAAQNWMAARNLFLPLQLRAAFPSVKWALPTPREVEQAHGSRLADPSVAFPAPDPVPIEQSHAIPGVVGEVSWLRFASTVAGAPDTAWARVNAPTAMPDPPTLIFLHGIAVEAEFWATDVGHVDDLVTAGIRVVRPEAPWHGRRRAEGWFGGEPIIARGPLGLLDHFAAWVGEVARLLAWSRATSRGPVAIGGVSLGALTSQIAATAARHWPAAMRPDALFLIGTTGNVVDAATDGSLGRALGVGERLAGLSWTPPALQRWAPLLEPQGEPVMPPGAVVMLIGRSDDVTPVHGGMALARRWRLPPENLFLRGQGHFSVALGLERNAAPLARIAAILQGGDRLSSRAGAR